MSHNIAVFYHKADNDGVLSGVIAKHYLTPRFDTVDLIPIDYGNDFEAALPNPVTFYEEIYILDVSDATFMEKYGKKIVYIDHHKWAMDTMPQVKDRHCIDGVAACRLTFDYLTQAPNHVFHDTKKFFIERKNPLEPLVVAIIGEFDVWDKTSPLGEKLNYGQECKFSSMEYLFNITKGISVHDSWTCSDAKDDIGKTGDLAVIEANKNITTNYSDWSYLYHIITKGEGALDNMKAAVERIKPTKITIDGHEGVYINTSIDPSLVGMCYNLKHEEKFVMVWHLNNPDKDDKNKASVSFRSNKIDVSQIARKYGGGGHKAAAGCKMSLSQLFEIIKPEF